jgi:hypothetical protein
VTLPFSSSYAVLCAVQGLVVVASWRRRLWKLDVGPAVGLLAPVAALAIGVLAIRGVDSGAQFFASVAWIAALAGTAIAPRVLGWGGWWVGPPLALAAFLVAWRVDGRLADAAGLLLIAGACILAAAVLRAMTPEPILAAGLVALIALDAVLVLGLDSVRPATEALHDAVPPSASLPGASARPLPALQDATYGTALMGWLDVLAPAILGLLFTTRVRWRLLAAGATTTAALAWGLLFNVRSEIPATVPVLAGLAVWLCVERKGLYTRRP